MSESNAVEIHGGRLQDFTIDQMAGAIALSLGALGSLPWASVHGYRYVQWVSAAPVGIDRVSVLIVRFAEAPRWSA